MRNSLALGFAITFACGSVNAAGLSIQITDVASADGHVLVSVSGSADAWDGKSKPVAATRVAAQKGTVTVDFPELAPGDYAVSVLHDANGNQRMDSNVIGIPTEGYGFSNNPRVMRKATFDEARFAVGDEPANITVQMR